MALSVNNENNGMAVAQSKVFKPLRLMMLSAIPSPTYGNPRISTMSRRGVKDAVH